MAKVKKMKRGGPPKRPKLKVKPKVQKSKGAPTPKANSAGSKVPVKAEEGVRKAVDEKKIEIVAITDSPLKMKEKTPKKGKAEKELKIPIAASSPRLVVKGKAKGKKKVGAEKSIVNMLADDPLKMKEKTPKKGKAVKELDAVAAASSPSLGVKGKVKGKKKVGAEKSIANMLADDPLKMKEKTPKKGKAAVKNLNAVDAAVSSPSLGVKPKAVAVKKSKPAPKPKSRKVEKVVGESSAAADGDNSIDNKLAVSDYKPPKKKGKVSNKAKAVKKPTLITTSAPSSVVVDSKVEGDRRAEVGGDKSIPNKLAICDLSYPKLLLKKFKPTIDAPAHNFDVKAKAKGEIESSAGIKVKVKTPPKGSKSKAKATNKKLATAIKKSPAKKTGKPKIAKMLKEIKTTLDAPSLDFDIEVEAFKLPKGVMSKAKAVKELNTLDESMDRPSLVRKSNIGPPTFANRVKPPAKIQTPKPKMDKNVKINADAKSKGKKLKGKPAVVDNCMMGNSNEGQSTPTPNEDNDNDLLDQPSNQPGDNVPPSPPLSDGSFLKFYNLSKEERHRGYEESNLDHRVRLILEQSVATFSKTKEDIIVLEGDTRNINFQNGPTTINTRVANYAEIFKKNQKLEHEVRDLKKRLSELIDMYNNAYMKYQSQRSLSEQESLSTRNLEDLLSTIKEESNKTVKELEAKMQEINNKTNWCRKQYEREKITLATSQHQDQNKKVLEKEEKGANVDGSSDDDNDDDNFLDVAEIPTTFDEMKKGPLDNRDIKKIRMKLADFPDKLDSPSELQSAVVDLSDDESASTSGSNKSPNKSGANDSSVVAVTQQQIEKREDKNETSYKLNENRNGNVGGGGGGEAEKESSSSENDSSSSDDDDDNDVGYGIFNYSERNQSEDSPQRSLFSSCDDDEESKSGVLFPENAPSSIEVTFENIDSTTPGLFDTSTITMMAMGTSTFTQGNQQQKEKKQETAAVIPASQKSISVDDVAVAGSSGSGNRVAHTNATTSKSVGPIKKIENVKDVSRTSGYFPLILQFPDTDPESEIDD